MDYTFIKGQFTEAQLEEAIITLFEQQEYTYVHGESIHRKYEDILLLDDLRTFIQTRYANDGLSEVELQKIINRLQLIPASPLYSGNRETFWLINEGFDLVRDDPSKVKAMDVTGAWVASADVPVASFKRGYSVFSFFNEKKIVFQPVTGKEVCILLLGLFYDGKLKLTISCGAEVDVPIGCTFSIMPGDLRINCYGSPNQCGSGYGRQSAADVPQRCEADARYHSLGRCLPFSKATGEMIWQKSF